MELSLKSNESSNEAQNAHTSSEKQIFQEKLQTLQQNLAVMTEQKQHMEQVFQSDKRKLKVRMWYLVS